MKLYKVQSVHTETDIAIADSSVPLFNSVKSAIFLTSLRSAGAHLEI